jgi:hypothetical protein
MSAIVGATGTYKTGIAIDLTARISLDHLWYGRRVRRCVGLYLAVEGGRGIAERFAAWRSYHGVQADDGELFVIPEPIDLAHGDADTRLLMQRIGEMRRRPGFIVVDTTSRALAGGDENSSKDMGAFVRNCDLIRNATGAHLCSVHHLGKDESRGARGHSLLKAALDTELTATKSGQIGTIESTKQRDHVDRERWGFAIELVDLGDGKQSFVVVPADTPPATKSSTRWTRGLTVFRDALTSAILDHGQDHRPKGDGPIVKAVRVGDVRAAHSIDYIHGGEGDRVEAERKAWQRALKAARDNHLIGGERDLVWLVAQ